MAQSAEEIEMMSDQQLKRRHRIGLVFMALGMLIIIVGGTPGVGLCGFILAIISLIYTSEIQDHLEPY